MDGDGIGHIIEDSCHRLACLGYAACGDLLGEDCFLSTSVHYTPELAISRLLDVLLLPSDDEGRFANWCQAMHEAGASAADLGIPLVDGKRL